jgi:hypothetical protein
MTPSNQLIAKNFVHMGSQECEIACVNPHEKLYTHLYIQNGGLEFSEYTQAPSITGTQKNMT